MADFLLTSSKQVDKLLDKATSPLLLDTDWTSILQLCDVIKTHEVRPKHVIQAIKKKLRHENPHVVLNSLQCLECLMKNCGGSVQKEVAQKETMDVLKDLAKRGPDRIREKVLELVQCWSHSLGRQYTVLTETYHLMKAEKYRFPPLKESEAMFRTNDIAPEWRDDKDCFRCRQEFNTFVRKHHCRACGNVFCDKCTVVHFSMSCDGRGCLPGSSRSCPIPKFNIDQDVRVCESCYEKLKTGASLISKATSSSSSSSEPVSKTIPRQEKRQTEIDEEKLLQLALAISKSEADDKERQKKDLTLKYTPPTSAPTNPSEKKDDQSTEGTYQEQATEHDKITFHDSFVSESTIDQFTTLVLNHINNFRLRMLSDQQRQRNVATDTAVQSAFVTLQNLHPELHRFMQLLDDKRTCYETLQDTLTQLKDAREALDALRAEHYERKQQEVFERDRQRQIQLAQKLDFMRQKKQEYLEYQRQLHLQQLVQQELQMKMRLDQQRQFTFTREQLAQTSHMPMIASDGNQTFYTLPPPLFPDASMASCAIQQSQYGSMIMHPADMQTTSLLSNQSYLTASNTDNDYMHPTGQILLTNSVVPYDHYYQRQQSTPTMNENNCDPQLMIFN